MCVRYIHRAELTEERMKKILALLLVLLMCLPVAACGGEQMDKKTFTVSFAEKSGVSAQNLKKFDLFTSDWTWAGTTPGSFDEEMLTVVPAMEELMSENMRIGMGIGTEYRSIGYEIGRLTDGSTDEEYSAVFKLLSALEEHNVQPYLSICYGPDFSRVSGNWKNMPDAAKYETFTKNLTDAVRRNGYNAIYEVWNEPDNSAFFAGDWEDYTDTYIAGAKGIRASDPEAMLVGMSAAWMNERATTLRTRMVNGESKRITDLGYFIERMYAENVPADALSWHYYGQNGETEGLGEDSFSYYLNSYRGVLNEYVAAGMYPGLETVQTHLNEYNVYIAGTTEQYMYASIIPYMYKAMDDLLVAGDVTSINWAALVGEKNDKLSYELINGLSYERYPAFYALWMFARLPVDRVETGIEDEQVLSYAGKDDGRAGVLLCNDSAMTKLVTLNVKDLPFARADATLYIADDEHKTYSSSNVPYILAHNEDMNTEDGLTVTVELAPSAAAYFEFNDAAGTLSDNDYRQTAADYLRTDYWYPERRDGAPWSDFVQSAFNAYVGMSNNAAGKSAVCVTLENFAETAFDMFYEVWGGAKASAAASLGFRVDYEVADGGYANSVFYHFDGFGFNQSIPFGTRMEAVKQINIGAAGKGKVCVNLAENAPADWTGKVQITYLIKDAGTGACAKFLIR